MSKTTIYNDFKSKLSDLTLFTFAYSMTLQEVIGKEQFSELQQTLAELNRKFTFKD